MNTPTPADDWLLDLLTIFREHIYNCGRADEDLTTDKTLDITMKEITAHLKAAEVAARISELEQIPRTRSKQAYIEHRLAALEAESEQV